MFYLSVESCCYFAGWASSSLCVCGYGGACGSTNGQKYLYCRHLVEMPLHLASPARNRNYA